jgi:hypothetical protein
MATFQGFDTGSYPGDTAVAAWAHGGSPFTFVGFYLEAPCHGKKFTSWSGKLPLLKALGWGVVLVYVGRQVKGCGSSSLTAAIGTTDGADAIAKAKAEGFPSGAVVFLDIEPFDGAVPAGMSAYASAWLDAVLKDATFEPGIYCHAKNAIDLHTIGEARFAAAGKAGGAPRFWITRVTSSFDAASSLPSGSGISFADVWQGQIDLAGVTFANVSIDIDVNVATSANPSKA